MLRVQMQTVLDDRSTHILDWFVHRIETDWFLTISDVGSWIRSVPVEVSTDPAAQPSRVVAQLWPRVRSDEVAFALGIRTPLSIHAEIRVMTLEASYWWEASTWLWEREGLALAFRSNPVIRQLSRQIPLSAPGETAQACFDLAAELELKSD